MMISHWLGATVLVCLIALIFFAFRKGLRVKPDPNWKVEEWIDITWFGKGRQPMIDPPDKDRHRTEQLKLDSKLFRTRWL